MSIAPVVHHVVVRVTPDAAYSAWTDGIGSWWPLAQHSVHQQGSSVAFAEGRIVETSSTGETAVWGTVVAADPPTGLRFTWHPGRGPESAGIVGVDFVPVGSGHTLVRLTHTGWEALDDPIATREDYRTGWPGVLERYVASIDEGADEDADVWLVLEHTPGERAGPSVFAHPLFAEHLAFLERLRSAGVLIAAGPLADAPGSGQAIIRVPERDAARHVADAHHDAAVRGDLLVLRVRPWRVVVTGPVA